MRKFGAEMSGTTKNEVCFKIKYNISMGFWYSFPKFRAKLRSPSLTHLRGSPHSLAKAGKIYWYQSVRARADIQEALLYSVFDVF